MGISLSHILGVKNSVDNFLYIPVNSDTWVNRINKLACCTNFNHLNVSY